ncbi:MAG TPA: hypothetical protein VH008_20510 [Pseudonocardia sp.]|nr:hypothetical protein [Pseudonocardia sp.]
MLEPQTAAPTPSPAEATQLIHPQTALAPSPAEATQLIQSQTAAAPSPAEATQLIQPQPPDASQDQPAHPQPTDETRHIPIRPGTDPTRPAPGPPPAPGPTASDATQQITVFPTAVEQSDTQASVAATQQFRPQPASEATQLIRPVAAASADAGDAVNGDGTLLGQARALLRATRQIYPDAPQREQLAALAERLDEPTRVAVLGAAGAGTRTLLRALRNESYTPALTLTDQEGAAAEPADAVLMVLRGPGLEDASLFDPAGPDPDADPEHPKEPEPAHTKSEADGAPAPAPAEPSAMSSEAAAAQPTEPPTNPLPTIGVLARADELGGSTLDALDRAKEIAAEYRNAPEIAPHCQTVVPVAALLAVAGGDLEEAEFQSLLALSQRASTELAEHTTPALLARLGWFGIEQALRLIRAGRAPSPAKLGEELVRISGMQQLRDVLTWRFARPAQALRVRSTLAELERLVRSSPERGPRVDQLLYQLERIRSGAHELVEIDLADALRAGTLRFSAADRTAAEQLLGAEGAEPSARLGLAADATPEAIRDAAGEQLAHWQRLASHPATTTAVRDAAEVLVRTCEEFLAGPTP